MFTRVSAEGTTLDLIDPDASLLRDALPGQGYEPTACAVLAEALAAGHRPFFDVGALYGFFSIWAALRGAPVVAFEPGPQYVEVLDLNRRLNRCAVRVERLALADRNGRQDLSGRSLRGPRADAPRRSYVRGLVNQLGRRRPGGDALTAADGQWRARVGPWVAATLAERLGLFAGGPDHAPSETRVARLDDWVAESGIAPGVVKIDVHGAEVAVLRGMPRTLRDHVEAVLVEVHTADLLTAGTHAEIVEHLEASGLAVYELRGFRRRRATLVPMTGRERQRFCDQRQWTAEELYFMRCLYARRS